MGKYQNIVGSLLALYFFISGIMLIKSSASLMAEFLAEKIVSLIRDTTSAVFAGWIGTALLHSSGAFDSIVVALASSGAMPLSLAVSTIIGAELGTTVTPFLISLLGLMRGKGEHAAAFNVTISHVLYNVVTLLIFWPAELFFGLMTTIALKGSTIFVKASWLEAVPDILNVITPWVKPLLSYIPPWVGILCGAAMLILALGGIEKYMTEIFNMPRSWNLIRSTFKKPLRAFLAGFLFTLMIPSTTVMVSLLIPLASSSVIDSDYYILPYIPPWIGILGGAAMLILALGGIEKYMTEIFNMPRSWNLIRSTFKKPLRAFLAGFLFTLMIPSTTVMVSLLIPLASSGVIDSDYYILPYILGANIGTVFDVMIAAMATGDPFSMGIWLVHLSINLIGALIFLPMLKPFSILIKKTANYIAFSPRRALFIAIIFHLIPISIILFYLFT